MAPIVTRVTWPRFIYDLLGEVLNNVQASFDLIVIDIGPASQLIAELSDPRLLVDASLIVHNGNSSQELAAVRTRLQAFGISKFMVAQNSIQKVSANVA